MGTVVPFPEPEVQRLREEKDALHFEWWRVWNKLSDLTFKGCMTLTEYKEISAEVEMLEAKLQSLTRRLEGRRNN